MCVIYTSRVGYRGLDRLNITVKSGSGAGRLFAPTWELVGGIKHQETAGQDARWAKYAPLTQDEYSAGYNALVRARYQTAAAPFLELLERERLTLCCYCAAGRFCHRHLAVDILEKIAVAQGLSFVRGGELPMR
jgi:uncharacterized protein YeaO (DUF488 family)